jgi:hypothetical protein
MLASAPSLLMVLVVHLTSCYMLLLHLMLSSVLFLLGTTHVLVILLILVIALNSCLVVSWKLWVLNIIKEEFELAFAINYFIFRQKWWLALSWSLKP